MSPGYVPRSRECVPWGVAIRGGCHKHELLKITDKLIFSPLIISNRFTFLIIKYTFSSKLFSSTAYINMRTQAGKSTWLRKHTATADKQKWRWEQSHSGFHPKWNPRIYLCWMNGNHVENLPGNSPALCVMGEASQPSRPMSPFAGYTSFLPGAKVPPTLQTVVFPNSSLHLGNTCSPSVSGQHERMEGVNHFGSVTISWLLEWRPKTTFKSVVKITGGKASIHRAEGTGLGGLTLRRKERITSQ